MGLKIYPLFSSIVATGKVNFDVSNMFKQLKDQSKYPLQAAGSEDFNQRTEKVYSSRNNQVLKDFPREAKEILEAFNCFSADVLKQGSRQFVISRSWLTKSEKGSRGEFHSHENSFYSGVLYEKGGEGYAPFEIQKKTGELSALSLGAPSETNVFNATKFSIDCEAGLIVFFPSGLMHRIGNHNATAARYSIAFNLFPVGLIGEGDSSVSLQVD